MKNFLSLLLLLQVAYSCSFAQNNSDYGSLITETSSREHLTTLTSKEFAGRGTGQEGGLKAANYIAEKFKSYDLKPVVDNSSYLQQVQLIKKDYEVKDFSIGTQQYINGKDFYILGDNTIQSFDANEIVFVGYGIQDRKYNELAHTDIRDKVVLVIDEGEPTNSDGLSILTGSTIKSNWSKNNYLRIQELIKLKPKVILSTNSKVANTVANTKAGLTSSRFSLESSSRINNWEKKSSPIIVNITEDLANKILATVHSSIDTYKTQAARKVQKSTIIPIEFHATMGLKEENIEVPNVLGLLEGNTKKDEIIVVCGHYDHDGILPDGTFFPGADDNGSGTVAVLEIAKAFSKAKKEGNGPQRSILFIGLAAEEKGLLGSAYYVEHPILPLQNTVACINIDMIGRIDDKHLNGNHNYIHVIGVNKLSTDLKPIVELANQDLRINLDYDYDHPEEPMRLYYRSDHYNFAKNGIPSLFFFSGLHPHYHTTEDTIEKINFPMMIKREKLIFNTVWELANRDSKPKVNLPLEDAKGLGR